MAWLLNYCAADKKILRTNDRAANTEDNATLQHDTTVRPENVFLLYFFQKIIKRTVDAR